MTIILEQKDAFLCFFSALKRTILSTYTFQGILDIITTPSVFCYEK